MTEDLTDQPAWPARACRGQDPTLFHVRDGEHWRDAQPRLVDAARSYCARCPIRLACRDAGQHGEWGLWGGVLHSRGGGYVIATDLLDTTKGK